MTRARFYAEFGKTASVAAGEMRIASIAKCAYLQTATMFDYYQFGFPIFLAGKRRSEGVNRATM